MVVLTVFTLWFLPIFAPGNSTGIALLEPVVIRCLECRGDSAIELQCERHGSSSVGSRDRHVLCHDQEHVGLEMEECYVDSAIRVAGGPYVKIASPPGSHTLPLTDGFAVAFSAIAPLYGSVGRGEVDSARSILNCNVAA